MVTVPNIRFWILGKNALVPPVVGGMAGKWGMPLVISSPSNSFPGPKWVGMPFLLSGVITITPGFTLMTISVPIRTDWRVLSTKLVYFLSIREKTE